MTILARRTLLASLAAVAVGCGRRDRLGAFSNRPSGREALQSSSENGRIGGSAAANVTSGWPATPDANSSVELHGIVRRELAFETSPVGPERVIALIPESHEPDERFPVLIALHGRGESVRGVEAGAYGWVRDYQVERTLTRLKQPPLTQSDWHGYVDESRLSQVNAALSLRPYQGLIIVCPWLPDLMAAERDGNDLATPFARFILEQLLPRIHAETPSIQSPASTGIDGVSLGGRAALLVGLAHPERFGAVGTLQPAIQRSEATAWARKVIAARARTRDLKLRLLTSDGDYFRLPVAALDAELVNAGVEHDYVLARGPHDYPFNRGPGGIEMLLWHDRVLRGQTPV